MRIKIPALALLCAVAGWLVSSDLNAADAKKPVESKKSALAKKTEPVKKPESKKRRSPRREAVEAELKKLRDQLAENGKELEKARESLHTAQKELAAKAQSIKSMEAKKNDHEEALKKANEELKKYKSSDFNKLAHTLDAERKKNAALQIQLKEFKIAMENFASQSASPKKPEPKKPEPKKPEPKKPEPKKPEPKKPEPKKPEPKKPEPKKPEPKKAEPKKAEPKKAEPKKAEPKKAEPKKPEPKKPEPKKPEKPEPKKAEPKKAEPKKPEPKKPDQASTVAPVYYDLNSAVNYKERDRVLRQVRDILKKSPKAAIQITGYADDTPYRETNNDVGANRAKFLLKYLCLNGVPEKQLSSRGIGSPKQGRGDGNRRAVIQIRN